MVPFQLQIFDDVLALSRAAAELLATLARENRADGRPFSLALSGGSTPRRVYQLLGQPPYRLSVPWADVHIFWGDERCVPPDHPESNFGQAYEDWLVHVPIPAPNLHRIKGELGPEKAAADYAEQLRRYARVTLGPPRQPWPNFSAALLGLGEDGHTASLFPGPAAPGEATQPTLAVTARYQGRPAERVTLTPLVFNAAHELIVLATGAGKAAAVAAAFNPARDPERWPIQRLQPKSGRLLWLVDRAAASQLDPAHFTREAHDA